MKSYFIVYGTVISEQKPREKYMYDKLKTDIGRRIVQKGNTYLR